LTARLPSKSPAAMRRAAALLVLAACGEVKNGDPDAASAIDGAAAIDGADTVDAAPGAQDWGAPVPLDEFNDPATGERFPSVTGDGLEMIFQRRRTGERFSTLWVTRRASLAGTWSTPEQIEKTADYTDPELSFDGLELYVVRSQSIYRSRRMARTEAWPSFTRVIESVTSPTAQDDGVTLYVNTLSPNAFPRKYTRPASSSDTWSDGGGTPFEYPDPPAGEYFEYYDVRDGLLVFSSPTSDEMPAVATVELLRTGFWGNYRAVPSLADGRVSQCEVVSKAEIVCGHDSDGDGLVDDLARVTRTLDP
jgi:hypothetical protein